MLKQLVQQLTFPKELNLIFLSTYLFAVAVGMNFVTFPTILTQHGIHSAQIGIAATLDIIAGITMSFFLSRIAAKLGLMRTLMLSSSSFALCVAIIFFYHHFYLWLFFCTILGASFFTFIITRQAWLNSLLSNDLRSIALGIFTLTIFLGLATGPIFVSILGAHNYTSFLTSAILTLLSFQVIARIKSNYQPTFGSQRITFKAFFYHNPRCFLAKFFLEFQNYFLLIFTVIFGNHIGLSPEKSGLLITVSLFSGIFNIVIGFIIKKYKPYRLINIGFLGCLTFFIIINFFHQSYLFLLLIYFLFGLFMSLIFVSTFTIVNQDYSQDKLVAANATFQAIGSIGGLTSTMIGGFLIKLLGAQGFTLTIIFGCLCYLIFLLFYKQKFIQRNVQ